MKKKECSFLFLNKVYHEPEPKMQYTGKRFRAIQAVEAAASSEEKKGPLDKWAQKMPLPLIKMVGSFCDLYTLIFVFERVCKTWNALKEFGLCHGFVDEPCGDQRLSLLSLVPAANPVEWWSAMSKQFQNVRTLKLDSDLHLNFEGGDIFASLNMKSLQHMDLSVDVDCELDRFIFHSWLSNCDVIKWKSLILSESGRTGRHKAFEEKCDHRTQNSRACVQAIIINNLLKDKNTADQVFTQPEGYIWPVDPKKVLAWNGYQLLERSAPCLTRLEINHSLTAGKMISILGLACAQPEADIPDTPIHQLCGNIQTIRFQGCILDPLFTKTIGKWRHLQHLSLVNCAAPRQHEIYDDSDSRLEAHVQILIGNLHWDRLRSFMFDNTRCQDVYNRSVSQGVLFSLANQLAKSGSVRLEELFLSFNFDPTVSWLDHASEWKVLAERVDSIKLRISETDMFQTVESLMNERAHREASGKMPISWMDQDIKLAKNRVNHVKEMETVKAFQNLPNLHEMSLTPFVMQRCHSGTGWTPNDMKPICRAVFLDYIVQKALPTWSGLRRLSLSHCDLRARVLSGRGLASLAVSVNTSFFSLSEIIGIAAQNCPQLCELELVHTFFDATGFADLVRLMPKLIRLFLAETEKCTLDSVIPRILMTDMLDKFDAARANSPGPLKFEFAADKPDTPMSHLIQGMKHLHRETGYHRWKNIRFELFERPEVFVI
jgi:hypothetical protein